MDEVTCQKCGNICEIEYMHDKSPGWGEAWCYECEDYPEGFDASENQRDWIADATDAAHERFKDRQLLGGSQ